MICLMYMNFLKNKAASFHIQRFLKKYYYEEPLIKHVKYVSEK